MARGRGPARGRGRSSREDAAPVVLPVGGGGTQDIAALDFAEPDRFSRSRGGRASGGGGGGGKGGTFGLIVPLASAIVAAIICFVGAFLVTGPAKKGMGQVADQVGASAALALAVTEPEWWESTHGTGVNIESVLKPIWDEHRRKAKATGDVRDTTVIEDKIKAAIEEWGLKADVTSADRDAHYIRANRERLKRLVTFKDTPVLWAAVTKSDGTSPICLSGSQPTWRQDGPTVYVASVKAQNDVSATPVVASLADGRVLPARLYIAPIYDRFGAETGKVKILVSTISVVKAGGSLTVYALIAAILGLLVVGATAFFLCMGPAAGMKSVTAGLEQVARGDLDVRFSGGGGDGAVLVRAADRAVKTMKNMQNQAASAPAPVMAAGPAIDTSGLLPTEPPRIDGYEMDAVHKPTFDGANDYYDYIEIDDNHLGIVIADMPHPGAKGAFIASTFRALVRAYAVGETSPAAVLSKVNRVMAGELKRGDHITAMYTVLDREKGIIAVASAGHLPLIFWKLAKKGSALLNPEGIAIGLDKGPVFEKTVVDKRIKLEKDDRIVLHTDGPVAAKNMQGEEYGEQRFYYLVSREAPKNSAAFVNFVANEVDLYHEGAHQEDDITLVTLRKTSD